MELAINGGNPIIENPVKMKWPIITKKIEEAVIDQLFDTISIYNKSNIIEKMEKAFSEYHSQKYGLLTNSGTTAILSALYALNLEPDDEVICPAYTFFATVSPIFFTGAKPILVDCDHTGNISVEEIKLKITKKTKAILVTHMWGRPVDYIEIRKICDDNNLYFLEDCSHAHGASYQGIKVGSLGDIAMFSLQGQKNITGGEGGILITSNNEFYYNALMLGHYNKRCVEEIPDEYKFKEFQTTGFGLKLRSHPIAVRIAYEMFLNIEEMLEKREKIGRFLLNELKDIKGIDLIEVPKDMLHAWYVFPFLYNEEALNGVKREKFVDALIAEGCLDIDIPNSTCPLNHLPLFQYPGKIFKGYDYGKWYDANDFPTANQFYNRLIKMPVWMEDNFETAKSYVAAIKKVVKNIDELKE